MYDSTIRIPKVRSADYARLRDWIENQSDPQNAIRTIVDGEASEIFNFAKDDNFQLFWGFAPIQKGGK